LFGFVIFSCKANSVELWLTHCWPSVYAAVTSMNRFGLFEVYIILLIVYYFAIVIIIIFYDTIIIIVIVINVVIPLVTTV